MKIKYKFPEYVTKVARMLVKEGYKCYQVGGSLRDIVLGVEPDDYDLATNAKPEDMLKIFPKAISVGARFGMVAALVPDESGEVYEVQVTTFRNEEKYVDGRWPSSVTFIEDVYGDLSRRDFTFNAMAVDFSQISEIGTPDEWEIYDPFDGLTDLGLRVVRAVGAPIERFKEDGLRVLRGCRLASQLEFDIETETFEAMKRALPVVALLSKERVRDEFLKILYHSKKPSIGIELLRRTGVLELFIPELLEGVGVEQKLFHGDDVYTHLLRTCDAAPDNIKLAALFHDIGKPRKDMKNGHFYGHDEEGAEMARQIMTRLRFSNAEIRRTSTLIKNHMFFYPHYTEDMSEAEKDELKNRTWSDSAVRRFISRVGEENIEDLFALRVADAASNPKTAFKPEEIELLQKRISEIRIKDMAFKITDLAVDGVDLIEIGIEKGPVLGNVLQELLEIVLEDPLLNTKEILLTKAREIYENIK